MRFDINKSSFFVRVFVGLLVVLVLLGAASIVQTRSTVDNLFTDLQEKRAVSVAAMLASRASNMILVHNYYDLHDLAKTTKDSEEDVRYVYVVSNDGELLAHSFPGGFPSELLNVNNKVEGQKYKIALFSTEEGMIRDVAVPIFDGRLGMVHVGFQDAQLRAILEKTTQQLVLDTILAAIIATGLAILLARRLTKPITDLVRVTNAITMGDLSQRAKVSSNDEFGKLAAAFNSMADHLQGLLRELKQKEESRSQLLQKVITAQEEERQRIARELHDQTGQTLSSLMMGLKCIAEQCPNSNCELDGMRATIKQTLGDIHRLAVDLRPSVLDDMGLVAALEKLVSEYQSRHQIDVDLHAEWCDQERLHHDMEVTVYRIVQEAMTNISKYAQAENVSIIINKKEDELSIIIEDDGVGFEADNIWSEGTVQNRLGLYGMRERAMLVGGTLTIESTPGIGTTIYARVSLRRE